MTKKCGGVPAAGPEVVGGEADRDTSMTFWRAVLSVEFWALIATGLAGAGGSKWWLAVPICTVALFLCGLEKYVAMWARVREAGAERVFFETLGLSLLNAGGAAAAVFVFGIFNALFWNL
jgi:hypothetical protein